MDANHNKEKRYYEKRAQLTLRINFEDIYPKPLSLSETSDLIEGKEDNKMLIVHYSFKH